MPGLTMSADPKGSTELRKFFHDLATPLSAASLHLERASRLIARGEDAEDALSTAREQLDRAFALLERGREELLA
jgi:signal transduction histidine kinase